jgi:hypothetical protein
LLLGSKYYVTYLLVYFFCSSFESGLLETV